MDSAVLLSCLGLADRENRTGNSNLGKLWFAFPPCISCTGRNFQFKVMIKVVVILLLSLKPEMRTEFELFSAIFILLMETYFELIWSRFSTNDEEIWNFFTLLTTLCKNIISASFFAPAGISTFYIIPAYLTNSMRWSSAAVRGYHCFKTIWQTKENKELVCQFENGNSYEMSPIKTCDQRGTMVGHLSRKVSRITKFNQWSWCNSICYAYRNTLSYITSRQGWDGLEIPWKVFVSMRETCLNLLLLESINNRVTSCIENPKKKQF